MSDFEMILRRITYQRKVLYFLYGEKVNDKEYMLVLYVWNKFEMKAMKDYHDLHLKSDILLKNCRFWIIKEL